MSGGSSTFGVSSVGPGEMEKVEPESDTRDGAPSLESVRDTSEAHGDGSDGSTGRLVDGEKVDVIVSGR